MNENMSQRQNVASTVIGIVVLMEAVVFLLAALLHLGVPIPLGFSEPRILPAAIVEGLIGLVFAASAYAVFAHQSWARLATMAAHALAIGGTLLGVVAMALGPGLGTEANKIFHWVMFVIAATVLVFLWTPEGKSWLDRSNWI
ncbi:MAG: hypothetical protein L0332_31690 [Chloroflexi bacterium]|nr:hypothetical protein [Chloroflexota bacterium]MCI0575307.1 hypothetical protein [Chloroflexota bacterium]MCI0647629.1 hypothetical protein [Chloroflexota bacterium]MCI0731266.1 hypothetical protein [Chloroflexota bacterium]